MKLSKKFLQDYVDIDIDAYALAEDLTKVGNEYDSVKSLACGTNLIIGEVLECSSHPDSDHLHVCKVNVGNEILGIVCGAPNVRKGLKVIVALSGCKLTGGEIKKSVIRGVESNGMLCSLEELGIEHKYLSENERKGIHELPDSAPIGENPLNFLELDDEVIDFELTANRGDLLSILGFAYEVGCIYSKKVKEIETSYKEVNSEFKDTFKLNINTEDCKCFYIKEVKSIKIEESPLFIKNRLIASGIRPINNIVDISNYVMIETGQPLHFYDADILNNNLGVRHARENEELITLDNEVRKLSSDDIVITSDDKAVGLAGVMGGLDTEITNNTKNIIIESAIFDSYKVRYTSKRILRSEASNRFEKGLDPNRTLIAINRACNLLETYASGLVSEGIISYNELDLNNKVIDITLTNINNILGLDLTTNEVVEIFDRLGFESKVHKDLITVSVPTRRIDISIKEDLIEEVGRIYGVDNIKGVLPILSTKPGHVNKFNRTIRNKMIALGFNETLTYSLISKDKINRYTLDEFEPIKILDPLTDERTTLRYSLIPSLMEVYEYNKSRNIKDICIFEIGKGFSKKEEEYKEEYKLSALLSGNYISGIGYNKEVDYYVLKGVVEELLNYLGYDKRYTFEINAFPNELHPGQSSYILVDHKKVGLMGRVHPSLSKDTIYVFEINLKELKDIKIGKQKYKEITKYPGIIKDSAFIVDKNITSLEILNEIKKASSKLIKNVSVFDLYEGANLNGKKSLAFKIEFESMEKTLTEEEVIKVFNEINDNVIKKFNAILRDK